MLLASVELCVCLVSPPRQTCLRGLTMSVSEATRFFQPHTGCDVADVVNDSGMARQ